MRPTAALTPPRGAPHASIYFGQPTPGLVPVRFAPGIVSTDAVELNGVFTAVSPDGRELYFLGNHPHPYDEGVRAADIWARRHPLMPVSWMPRTK